MFIKLCVSIVIVFYFSNSFFVQSQRVVWDNLIDLCYGPRPERVPNRCEGDANIKFERRLYRNSIPYYCLVINNTEGAYNSLVIEFDGEKAFRKQHNFYAKAVPTDDFNREDSFELENDIVKIVIYPLNSYHLLQRVIQIKLDNNTQCDTTQSIYFDPVYSNQLNNNNGRLLNSCFDIKSRAQRERNKCELLDEVIVEEMKFNNELRYFCIVFNKNLRKNENSSENELIEIQLSTNNAKTLFSPKTNSKYKENVTNLFRYIFIREQMFIALLPKSNHANIGNITSIRVNGVESCSGFIVKPRKKCGQIKIKYKPLITFGLDTQAGEFPWHVGLFEHKGVTTSYICGGSIIGRKTILTAAHCVDRPHGRINEESLRVTAGLHDRTISNSNSQDFLVLRYVLPKNRDKATQSGDIALLKLHTYIVYTDYIQPICFMQDKRMFEDREGSVVGWGYDENANLSNILKRAPLRIIPNPDCRNSDHDFYDSLVNESTFCAGGYQNGTNACEGDSGGGLVFNFDDGWYVRGVVSLAKVVLNNQQKRCDSLKYVVFTDVSEFSDWLVLQLADEHEE